MNNNQQQDLTEIRAFFGELLQIAYGPLIATHALWRALGYKTATAMRSALLRDTYPDVVPIEFPHRHGKFALTQEVGDWLIKQRCQNGSEPINLKIPELIDYRSAEVKAYLDEYGVLLHEKDILAVLHIDDRHQLIQQNKKGTLPFPVFTIEHRRTQLYALIFEVIPFLLSDK